MLYFVIAIAIDAAATGVVVLARSFGSNLRIAVWLTCSVCVACSPSLIPVGSIWRLVASLVAIGLLVKLYDTQRSNRQPIQEGSASRILWFANFFWLVKRLVPPAYKRYDDFGRLVDRGIESLASLALLWGVFQFNWLGQSFLLEHCAKATATFFVVVAVTQLAAVTWRRLAGRAWDPMRVPIAATTPADFWRRWNVPAQQFLKTYVFDVAGGSRHLIAATLATFVVSGMVHEYVFGIAAGRVQGWQLLFFLIQGAAVVATQNVRLSDGLKPVGQLATIAFNLSTSILFFQSVNEVLPFYALRD